VLCPWSTSSRSCRYTSSSSSSSLSISRATGQGSSNISGEAMRYATHHAPHSSQAMKYYLDEDPSNIVAVHCLAGTLHSRVCHKLVSEHGRAVC
jgi:hypothetical protein